MTIGKQYSSELGPSQYRGIELSAYHYHKPEGKQEGDIPDAFILFEMNRESINWHEKSVIAVKITVGKHGKNKKAMSLTSSVKLDDLQAFIDQARDELMQKEAEKN